MTDERIIAYLLEELPEEDLERFEDECFAQESWPTEINAAEADLIDSYLRDELAPERRQRFEQNYLTTEARQERVIIAAALLRHVDEYNDASKVTVAESSPGLTWADRFRAFWSSRTFAPRAVAAIAVMVVVAGALYLLFLRAPSPRTFATLTLTISSNDRAGGAEVGKVKTPINADALKISLILPRQSPPAARYRVELENVDGESKSPEVAVEDDKSVLAVIPATQLARGQYALKLFAIKAEGTEQRVNGSYFFIVE